MGVLISGETSKYAVYTHKFTNEELQREIISVNALGVDGESERVGLVPIKRNFINTA